MTAVVPSDLTELIVIDPKDALTTFTTRSDLDAILAKVRAKLDAFEGDATTPNGREQIKSVAFAVTKSKTALEAIGERLAKEAKALPTKIDAGRKHARDTLDAWRDEVRKPVTIWETAEESRIKKHTDAIAAIRASIPAPANSTAESIRGLIARIDAIEVGPACEEYAEEYQLAKKAVLPDLRAALGQRTIYEDEQAELAKLRAEAAERSAKDAEIKRAADAIIAQKTAQDAIAAEAERAVQREREAAEQRAQSERDAATRREADLKAQAEAAEQRARDTEARIKRESEQQAADERTEQERREKDRTHRGKINSAAVVALIAGGIPEEFARVAVTLIARKAIPQVSINY